MLMFDHKHIKSLTLDQKNLYDFVKQYTSISLSYFYIFLVLIPIYIVVKIFITPLLLYSI